MSLYATAADFLDYFQEDESTWLSNQDDPESDNIGDSYLQRFLDNAEAEALPYLGRYAHPIANPPPYLIYAICAIARKQAERYGHRESVIQDYKDAIVWLKNISNGNPLMGANGLPVAIAPAETSATNYVGGNIGLGSSAVSGGSYGRSIEVGDFEWIG